MMKCGETPLEGEGHVKTCDIIYVFSIYEFEPTLFSIYIQLGQGFECEHVEDGLIFAYNFNYSIFTAEFRYCH